MERNWDCVDSDASKSEPGVGIKRPHFTAVAMVSKT